MFEGEPCTNFVKKKIRILDEEVFDSREESSSDDSSGAFQRRKWLVDSPKFVKDAAPVIAACLRNTECIADVFHIPIVIPESKRTLFEIWAYSSVNHSDFNDLSLLNDAKCSSEGDFLIWLQAFQRFPIIIICAHSCNIELSLTCVP